MKVKLDRLRYNFEAIALWPLHCAMIRHMAWQVGECWEGRMCPSQYQKKQLSHLLRHVNRWVPAYKGTLDDAIHSGESATEIVKSLPFISKDDVRNRGASNFSHNPFFAKKDANTGGSSGQPLDLRYHSRARPFEMGHQLFFWKRGGYRSGDIIVSFDGITVPQADRDRGIYWSKRFPKFPFGAVRYSAHYWNEQTIPAYLKSVASLKPPFIRGYPSFLRQLCDAIRTHNIPLWKVKAVMLTSEAFDQSTMDYISQTFDCPVFGQYGHTEGAVFAFTEANQSEYYCSPLHGITEVVRPNTLEPCTLGEEGEVVVTGFCNTAQPLIRYRTGDVAVYGGEKNGFTILSRLVGRVSDYIINREGNKVFLVGLVFGQHLHAFSSIKRWQFIQRQPGSVEIRIDPSPSYTDENDREIEEKIGMTANVHTDIVKTTDFIQTMRGKVPFVVRESATGNPS